MRNTVAPLPLLLPTAFMGPPTDPLLEAMLDIVSTEQNELKKTFQVTNFSREVKYARTEATRPTRASDGNCCALSRFAHLLPLSLIVLGRLKMGGDG